MYKQIEFKISGMAPLVCHNGQLADPLNTWSQAIKKVTGKRKKTEEDQEEIGRLEFHGSLYLDDDGRPVIPGENIEKMLVDAAKKQRLGREFTSAIISDGLWPIEYDGPKTADGLWKDKRFVDRRGVKVQQSRVIRTRPIFSAWSLSFAVSYLPNVLNVEQVRDAMATAGWIVGLGDHRPKYGRFEISA